MSRTFHEIFLLGRILQGIFFLARFLQDVLQKNALSCKTLKENLARSLQGTHFFSTRAETIPLKSTTRKLASFPTIKVSVMKYDAFVLMLKILFFIFLTSLFSSFHLRLHKFKWFWFKWFSKFKIVLCPRMYTYRITFPVFMLFFGTTFFSCFQFH